MPAGFVDVEIKDGAGVTRTGRFWSSDGTITGDLYPPSVITKSDGTVVDPVAAGPAAKAAAVPVSLATDEPSVYGAYETVAASQTAQVLGGAGATGDYLYGLLVVPATTSPQNVIILDNATSITVFAGGASSVSNLVPFWIPINAKSVSGAWKVTTGTNVSVIAVGSFSA